MKLMGVWKVSNYTTWPNLQSLFSFVTQQWFSQSSLLDNPNPLSRCLLFIRGSWVRNQKLGLTNFQSLVSSPSILLLLLETILGSNIGCGAIGNNIGRGGCKQAQRSWGAVSVTKASDETVDGPSYKLWRELPPMLVERLFFGELRKEAEPVIFLCSIPGLSDFLSTPFLDWFHLRPYLGLKQSTTPDWQKNTKAQPKPHLIERGKRQTQHARIRCTIKELSSTIFIGPRSGHSPPMSVTDWLTDWVTNLLKMKMNELT